MDLATYLDSRGISGAEFGRLIGRSRSAVALYVQRKRIPRPKTMAQIMAATAGAVTAADFYDQPADRAA